MKFRNLFRKKYTYRCSGGIKIKSDIPLKKNQVENILELVENFVSNQSYGWLDNLSRAIYYQLKDEIEGVEVYCKNRRYLIKIIKE